MGLFLMPTEFGVPVTSPMQDISQTGRTVGATKSFAVAPKTRDGKPFYGRAREDGSWPETKLLRKELKSKGPSVKKRLAAESFIRSRIQNLNEVTKSKEIPVTKLPALTRSPLKHASVQEPHPVPHGIPGLEPTVHHDVPLKALSPGQHRQFIRSAKSVHRRENPDAEPLGLTKSGRDTRSDKIKNWLAARGINHTEAKHFASRQTLSSL